MNWTEQKVKRNKRYQAIYKMLEERYKTERCNGKENFRYNDGWFRLFEFPGEYALCIEYANNKEEAEVNGYEDGDRFYLDEMSEEEMLQAMIKEIEDD